MEWSSIYAEAMKHPRDAGFYSPAIGKSPRDLLPQITIHLKEWNTACINLTSALEVLSEREFSEYLIRHPFMGKVSFREMCYLQILHIIHHCSKVELKLKNTSKVTDLA